MSVLEGLKPERVFYYFEEISKIPHGSGNTKKISDFCVDFANKQGLTVVQDKVNNIIIYKDASEGYENAEPVVLQGHLDMVCEKTKESKHNFETDPLELYVDDGKVHAKDTTLGGDNGIAVAMALAVLEDNTLAHPPIEALFTIDEETGMDGALALDMSLLKGKMLINMDSEEEGSLIVGCAGGLHFEADIPIVHETKEGKIIEIIIEGLTGGHSGMEIHKQRGNAHKLMGRLLYHLSKTFSFNLVETKGGSKDNVIAQENKAVIVIDDKTEKLTSAIKEMEAKWKNEFASDEPNLVIKIDEKGHASISAFDDESTRRVIQYLFIVPNGAQVFERELANQVETSLNLGSVMTEENSVKAGHLARSSKDSQSEAIKEQLFAVTEAVGGKGYVNNEFPGWAYRQKSRLRELMMDSYKELYGVVPEILTIHAGLECGLFLGKNPELDCVSFGPALSDVHSPQESMDIASVERSYKYLLTILKNCK